VVIVIPCHRVVPKSGGLGNYSSEGGPETKRKLLEREGAPLVLEGKPQPTPGDGKSRTSITHRRS